MKNLKYIICSIALMGLLYGCADNSEQLKAKDARKIKKAVKELKTEFNMNQFAKCDSMATAMAEEKLANSKNAAKGSGGSKTTSAPVEVADPVPTKLDVGQGGSQSSNPNKLDIGQKGSKKANNKKLDIGQKKK